MHNDTASPGTGISPPARGGGPGLARPNHRGLRIAAVIGVGLAAVVVVTGLIGRAHDASAVKNWTNSEAIPVVRLVSPAPLSAGAALVLPGTLQAYYNAPIYARVPGYVHAWYADIGAQVKSGQLLATIDTPELDEQLVQARADLASAQANMKLASVTAERWSRMLAQDAVSKQETDEKSGDLAAKTAQVNAAKANVDRLVALKSFARIVAPFDGVVTARKTDIGDLVNAGATAAPNSELFDVAKVDQLRLYVHVPQNYSSQIRPGASATLSVPEYPGRTFAAQLNATAKSISDNSGTLLVELLVNNADTSLQAGDYAQVSFGLRGPTSGTEGGLELPSSALLFRSKGAQAAVVGPDNHVHIRSIKIGRDLGPTIEVTAGLTPSDHVIDNPPDSISEGQLVRVVQPASGGTAGGA